MSFEQKIPVTENGKTRRIPVLEVMLRRLANDAMRSDPGAVKLLLALDRSIFGLARDRDSSSATSWRKIRRSLREYLQSPLGRTSDNPLKPGDEVNGDGV